MHHTNRLSKEKSPYLLQHQHNPVDWYPWGNEAFETARAQDKPIFLSIGYSTCYWCHVMEKDSFEIESVAAELNKSFISIKVDREERPDVDQIYMDAVVGLTGHGGWPMSVFLTTEGKPFFGGTFFKREQFIRLLEKIAEVWKVDREGIEGTARQLSQFLGTEQKTQAGESLDEAVLKTTFSALSNSFDNEHGGFGRAPKFPPPLALSLLLRLHRRSKNARALEMVEKTLECLARGGIFDHAGGGFHRYSTDATWLIPHFEKMLYDNALIPVAFLEAYQLTGRKEFADVVKATLDYVTRDLSGPDGGFASAEDAGDVDEEGDFYVWTESELKTVLSADEFSLAQKLFDISNAGNFEHGKIVLKARNDVPLAEYAASSVQELKLKLFKLRANRVRPRRDDKIITAWNGLALTAFARAATVLGRADYLEAAVSAAEFLQKNLWKNGTLLRRYCDGEAAIDGYLEDYAFLIQGLLDLYEASAENRWFDWAVELQAKQDQLFWDTARKSYYFSKAGDPLLIVRKKDFNDGATPSGNSVSALNLLRLFHYTGRGEYDAQADGIFTAMRPYVEKYPTAFSALLIALDFKLDRTQEIVAIVPTAEREKVMLEFSKAFAPNKLLLCTSEEAAKKSSAPLLASKIAVDKKQTFYVCTNQTCEAPSHDSASVSKALESFESLTL